MTLVFQISYASPQTDDIERAREVGRNEARRRLTGRRGRAETLPSDDLAALCASESPIDAGCVNTSVHDEDGH